jgi:beta-lactamase regulating signal transducer with metallopeptidase domain
MNDDPPHIIFLVHPHIHIKKKKEVDVDQEKRCDRTQMIIIIL